MFINLVKILTIRYLKLATGFFEFNYCMVWKKITIIELNYASTQSIYKFWRSRLQWLRVSETLPLYILLNKYTTLANTKYFICLEHHEDFLSCHLTYNNLVRSIEAYQAKKSIRHLGPVW